MIILRGRSHVTSTASADKFKVRLAIHSSAVSTFFPDLTGKGCLIRHVFRIILAEYNIQSMQKPIF